MEGNEKKERSEMRWGNDGVAASCSKRRIFIGIKQLMILDNEKLVVHDTYNRTGNTEVGDGFSSALAGNIAIYY